MCRGNTRGCVTVPGVTADPIAAAAAATMARDALWRDPPPLAPGCDHDLQCLPVIEFRQTVLCRKCGGLDAETSRRLLTEPGCFTVDADGSMRPSPPSPAAP